VALEPGTVFAGFTIEATLGVGGMGTVYRARHPRLPRSDALKLLRPDLSYDPDFAVRFAREADIAARLDHPNIVGVNDRGVEDGQLWISMPYIAGMDAAQALAQAGGRLPAPRAVRIVGQIGAALDFAHRNGLWHRDVKPANIMLTPGEEGEPERVLLADFGIAKAADEGRGLTKTGNVIGTFDYAPPEQIEGRAFDHRVDIYALGCVLYKLLTGSVPYPGTSVAAALHGHLHRPPPRPTERTPWLAPALDDVIVRAMAKEPDKRYPSCRALAADARSALESLPAAPPLPYLVSARRADPDSTDAMILGPVDTEELSAADRDGLVELVRQSRLFDLPDRLPLPEADWADARAEPDAASTQPAAITIEVRAAGRAAQVTYVPGMSARPPELDDLVRGLEDRRRWQPADADRAAPTTGLPAPVTVIESRPDVASLPSLTAEPRPVQTPPPIIDAPPPQLTRSPSAASPAPRPRRRRLAGVLVAAVLVVSGVTALILINGTDPGGRTSAAPATSTYTGTDSGSETGLPSSADLGLPSGPGLAGNVLVANQQIDGNLDLYAVDSSTGQAQTRLTTDAALDFGPVIAPDRASVVYLHQQGDALELWVVATDGTGARPLFARTPPGCDSVLRPAWNPADPSMLAVVCLDAAGTATLQLLTPRGDRIRTLQPGLPLFDDLAFSPDGTAVVYWGSAEAGAGDGPLYQLATDGSTPAVLITDPSMRGADAIFSPDGSRIAFRAWVDDGSTPVNTEIFVRHEGANQVLAPDVGIDQDPAWSPDGSMIVFKSDRADAFGVRTDRLWIMFSDGTGVRLLTTDPVMDGYAPAWSNR